MVRRRLVWLNGLTLMALFALLVRVFGATAAAEGSEGASRRWQDTLAGRADLQHFQVLQVDDGRGRIRYRNGLALWDGAVVTEWAGHRWRIHSELPGAVDTLAGRVGKPDVWPNPHRAVAEQGRSGMELTFDAALQSRRPSLVARLRTPEGRVSSDTLYVAHALPGADVRTTLDVGWQRRAEAWLADHRVRDGAVVVLDVATNQMLAAAGVRAGHPDATVAVTPFTPGSIFKLVTGAAALDAYRARPDSVFLCLGGIRTPLVRMHCWRVHGRLSFTEALAESCDTAFAELGMAMGRAGLTAETHRLHLAETQLQTVDGRTVVREARSGVVFRRAGRDDGLLANTAIGQQDVRLSPLQVANLARTVAAGGRMAPVRLVLDLELGGCVLRAFPVPSWGQAMSRQTAHWLGAGMRHAVTSPTGTAHSLARAPVPAAVKTGTAELARGGLVNGWMAGYAPYAHPRIAFAVYVGKVPSAEAHHLTQSVARAVLETYRQFYGTPDIG